MSDTRSKFYNLFWRNFACQNLFLLSKEELLDKSKISLDSNNAVISYPRLILSNNLDSVFLSEKVELRRSNTNVELDSDFENRVENYKPVIQAIVTDKIKKDVELAVHKIEEKPLAFIFSLIKAGKDEDEQKLFEVLQKYKIIKPHINSVQELEMSIKRYIQQNFKKAVNNQTVLDFHAGLTTIKDYYTNSQYQRLISSNQITVNALREVDNYQSRLNLFEHLFESGIISPSKEDAFVECTECDPGTYFGTMKMRIQPRKANNLKCPICKSELTYYIPYSLHKDIFDIITSKDGLLLDAIANHLHKKEIPYSLNHLFNIGIEMDCCFDLNNVKHLVEVKMFKTENTTDQKLKQKIKSALSKLKKDTISISTNYNQGIQYFPILVINLPSKELLSTIEQEILESELKEIPVMLLSDFVDYINASEGKVLNLLPSTK
ncbi:hypothetical protein [uncultured Draconibacterium sp.]|uniref:hypothetical protein n=1 Tax=uncultured Draconibacterium sp. TaxID=1573823 RepID=UPI0029C79A7D|nr:hypothetical protein [uncultured Draconibacterium sp.]